MWFRDHKGNMVRINRSDFHTDTSYYSEISKNIFNKKII